MAKRIPELVPYIDKSQIEQSNLRHAGANAPFVEGDSVGFAPVLTTEGSVSAQVAPSASPNKRLQRQQPKAIAPAC